MRLHIFKIITLAAIAFAPVLAFPHVTIDKAAWNLRARGVDNALIPRGWTGKTGPLTRPVTFKSQQAPPDVTSHAQLDELYPKTRMMVGHPAFTYNAGTRDPVVPTPNFHAGNNHDWCGTYVANTKHDFLDDRGEPFWRWTHDAKYPGCLTDEEKNLAMLNMDYGIREAMAGQYDAQKARFDDERPKRATDQVRKKLSRLRGIFGSRH